jgi:Major Facilitator Superfamily
MSTHQPLFDKFHAIRQGDPKAQWASQDAQEEPFPGGNVEIAAEGDGRMSRTRVGAAAAFVFFTICAATYVVNAADRMIFPVVLRPIAGEYGLTLAQGGFLATIYLLGLGIGGIGTGYLLDRFPRKTIMIAGIVVYSVFTILTALAFGFLDMASIAR